MRDKTHRQGPALNRREALSLGLALATGTALSAGTHRTTLAQSTPQASPVAGDGYAHPDVLVDPGWLRDHLDDASTVVVGFMPVEEYEAAHIPGAVQIDWPELEVIDTSDASIERWQQDVQQKLGTLGIVRDSSVVVYDNGTLFAARLWWILRSLGHEAVRVLNGGLAAWQEAGNATETGPLVRTLELRPPYDGAPNGDVLAQLDEVMAALDDLSVTIVDARTPKEYAAGHIPGAVNINFPLNAQSEPPKFWKPADELRAMYEAEGVTPDRHVIPYCTSGVRSAVTAYTLYLIRYDDVALYTGSWQEWSEQPNAPITEGDQP